MKLTFIVNGTETIVTTKRSTLLVNACKKALEQTGNMGRPVTDFQAIKDDNFLNMNKAITNQWIILNRRETDSPVFMNEEDVIFLSLKAGMGA